MSKDRQRKYSDDEVSAILRLAMEGTSSDAELSHDGMSLDELLKVASEAGFDQDQIRTAAERLDTVETSSKKFDLLGCRPYTELVRVVDGEVTSENWDELVAEFRSAFQGPTGKASELGKSREWYAATELTGLQVSLKPENGRTKMKARLTAMAVPVMGYGVVTFMMGMTAIVVGKKSDLIATLGLPLSLLIGFVALLGALGVMRWLLSTWYRSMTRQMKDALDRAQDLLASDQEHATVITQVQVEDELRIRAGEPE